MSDTKPTRRIPFWLTLSVMANLLLVGLVGGIALRAPPAGFGQDGMGPRRPPVLDTASPEDRMLVRKIMMHAFRSAEDEVAVRRAARVALGEALQTDPYDPDAVRRAFNALRTSDEAVHSAIHDTLVDRLAELSLDQRKALADMMSREPGERHRRIRMDQGRRDDGPPDRD